MVKRIVATGGDSDYYPLLEELCASVRAFRSADQLGLAVIDAGLEASQREALNARYGARIVPFDWGFPLAERRARGREALKVQVARSFLDRLLPEAEVIAWIDGDAWVQDIAPLEMMFDAAERERLVIVSQASRYGERTLPLRWGPFGWVEPRSILYKNARRARLPLHQARLMADRAVLNSGVFAMARASPHWETWRRRHAEAIRRGRLFTSDQLSLGVAVYLDGVPVELAPEVCNYMGPWVCSDDERTLLEAFIPNATIGVVHMAGQNEIRRDPGAVLEIRRLDGGVARKSLRRFAWT